MRVLLMFVVGLILTAAVVRAQTPPPQVGALPPHPIDSAFERGRDVNQLTNGLLNNDAFKRAVAAALKAKLAQEAEFKKNPQLRAATPAQAARQAFLKALEEDAAGEALRAPPAGARK